MKFGKNMGVALHAALRKCSDSAATMAAWNLIAELDEPWDDLLEAIRRSFATFEFADTKQESRTVQLAVQLKEAVRRWEPWGHGHLAVALFCVFDSFTDGDWEAFASLLDKTVVKEKSGIRVIGGRSFRRTRLSTRRS